MRHACGMQDRGSSSLLSPEDLKRIVGAGAHDQHGKGNVNVGDGGVAFLLASAGAIPGGAPLVSHHTSQQTSRSCIINKQTSRKSFTAIVWACLVLYRQDATSTRRFIQPVQGSECRFVLMHFHRCQTLMLFMIRL